MGPMRNPAASALTLHTLERFFILGGCLLLAAWAAVTLWGQWSSARELGEFRRSLAVPDQALWSDARKRQYLDSLAEDPGAAIGILKIERLGLETPVFDGVTELNLNRGVARIEGTARTDEAANLGIAGHRDSYFRALKDIAPGDLIELTAVTGTKRYRVEETLVVDPLDVWVLEPTGTEALTLVTCYPFYFVGSAPDRFIVRARAVPVG